MVQQKVVMLKLKNSTSVDFKELAAGEVKSIIPVVAKDGKPVLLVNFYDEEFCLDASLFCDEIDVEEVDVNS